MKHVTTGSTCPPSTSSAEAAPYSAFSPAAPSSASSTTTTCTVRGPHALYSFLEQHHEKLDRQMKRLGVVQLVAGMGYFTPGQSEGGEEAQGKETAWIFARETKKVRKFAEEIFGKAGFAFEVVDPRLVPLPSTLPAPPHDHNVTPCTLHPSTAPSTWESEPLPSFGTPTQSAPTLRSSVTFAKVPALSEAVERTQNVAEMQDGLGQVIVGTAGTVQRAADSSAIDELRESAKAIQPMCHTKMQIKLPDPNAEPPSDHDFCTRGTIESLEVEVLQGYTLKEFKLNLVGDTCETSAIFYNDAPYFGPEFTSPRISTRESCKRSTEEQGVAMFSEHGMCSAYQLKPEPATGGYVWIPSALANSNIKLPRFEFELNKIPGVTRRSLAVFVTTTVIKEERRSDSSPCAVAFELEQKLTFELSMEFSTDLSTIATMDSGIADANVWPPVVSSSTAHEPNISADATSSNPPASRLSLFIQRLRETLSPSEDSRRRAP